MTIRQLMGQFCEHTKVANAIRESLDRSWDLASALVPYFDGPQALRISVGLAQWNAEDPDERPRVGMWFKSPYDGSNNSGFSNISPRQMRQVAAVRQLYEDYFDGKIGEVPRELPDAIRDLA